MGESSKEGRGVERGLSRGLGGHPIRWLVAAFLAGGLGFLLNGMAFPVFGDVAVILGGALALVVALTCGPLYGALAGGLAASRTWWLWGHPVAFVLGILEGAVVGWLVRRRTPAIYAACIFWIGLGAPLLFASQGLGFLRLSTPEVAWAIVLKQPMNGVLNVLVAELLLLALPIRRWLKSEAFGQGGREVTLRSVLLQGITLLSTLPLIGLALFLSHSFAQEGAESRGRQLASITHAMALRIDDYLLRHHHAMATLALTLDRGVEEDTLLFERRLEAMQRLYQGFLTLMATDAQGDVRASSPRALLEDQDPPPNVRDREYFQQARSTGSPFLSNIFRGRSFGTDAIVAVSAPYFDRSGRFLGIVEGSLGLPGLRELERDLTSVSGLVDAEVLLLDPAQRVVLASDGLEFQVLQNLSESPLVRTVEGLGPEGTFQVTLPMKSAAGEESISVTYVVHRAVGAQGWTVCGLVPLSQVHGGLETFYMLSILGVFLAIGLAVVLARRLADRVTVPLAGLLERVRLFRIDGTPSEPPSELLEAPQEIHQLAQDFDELCQRLSESYSDLEESLEERERLNGELQVLLTELDTKVKQRTAQLTTEKARAEDANRAKSSFLASTSHEIRTPLSGIISLTELLLEEGLEERSRRFATAILSSAETLLGILDDVLDFSKIEAGKLQLERVEFGLRSLLEGVITLLEPKAGGKGLILRYRVAPPVPPRFVGDPARLRQVLINLVGNAVKFTDQGEVVVGVEVLESREETCWIRWEVQDTGIGIGAGVEEQLFEPFVQSDSSTSRLYGGTGLGLTICKRLLTMMGGRIGAESNTGPGSCFWFEVPLEIARPGTASAVLPALSAPRSEKGVASGAWEVPAGLELAEESQTQEDGSSGSSGEGALILVVEDNGINRTVALSQLEALGYEAETAINGREALERMAKTTYAAVLMDCQMPELDGYEATRRLRARGDRTPVVAVTAHALKGERRRCLEAGMDDFLAKPLRLRELGATLRHWVGPPADEPIGDRMNTGTLSEEISDVAEEPSSEVAGEDPQEIPGLDLETISQIRQLGQDLGRDLLGQVVEKLVDSLPDRLAELRRFQGEKDGEALRGLAHSLKGSAGNAGIIGLSDLFSQLQDEADEQRIETLLTAAEEELQRVEPQLRSLLKER